MGDHLGTGRITAIPVRSRWIQRVTGIGSVRAAAAIALRALAARSDNEARPRRPRRQLSPLTLLVPSNP